MNDIVINTERLTVRYLKESDKDEFIRGYVSSLPSKNRFDDGTVDLSDWSDEEHQALLERRKREADSDYCYTFNVFETVSGKSIGYCNIRTICRENMQCAEIGYTVFNNYWGNGFGTEVVMALTSIGFDILGFHRLEAYVNLDNPISKRVLKKCGYKLEGIREAYLNEDGVWTDNEVYYKINNIT